jgi:hypothetical protein
MSPRFGAGISAQTFHASSAAFTHDSKSSTVPVVTSAIGLLLAGHSETTT